MTTHNLSSERIQQLPVDDRKGYDAIFNAHYLSDIPSALEAWACSRVLLVVSRSLDTTTDAVRELERTLGSVVVDKKIGVGSHSPYADVIDIAHRIHSSGASCVVSIGSSSYSDACKIAVLLHATLPPDFGPADMEALVDPHKGISDGAQLKPPTAKLIVVPTSLSASEWNAVSSCTNAAGKKQHFGALAGKFGAPDLILLDPAVAATAPERLWLSSGVRAVDHCVETMCNPASNEAVDAHMRNGLRALLRGLREYKNATAEAGEREMLLRGITECQRGAREAMLGLVIWRVPLGPSHAIGHQLGSVAGVMHGVTSCIMLAPVLRYTAASDADGLVAKRQEQVLDVFNSTLGWEEKSAGDAVEKFVEMLGLPTRLADVGVNDDEMVAKVAEKTMTDVWGGAKRTLEEDDVLKILNMVR